MLTAAQKHLLPSPIPLGCPPSRRQSGHTDCAPERRSFRNTWRALSRQRRCTHSSSQTSDKQRKPRKRQVKEPQITPAPMVSRAGGNRTPSQLTTALIRWRGAGLPVQISNWRYPWPSSMSMPSTTRHSRDRAWCFGTDQRDTTNKRSIKRVSWRPDATKTGSMAR